MNRVVGRKYPNDDLYKEYLISKGRITKSDKILITYISGGMMGSQYTTITYRKLFVKVVDNNHGIYRMKNGDFENWIIMKRRLEKLNKIKLKING